MANARAEKANKRKTKTNKSEHNTTWYVTTM